MRRVYEAFPYKGAEMPPKRCFPHRQPTSHTTMKVSLYLAIVIAILFAHVDKASAACCTKTTRPYGCYTNANPGCNTGDTPGGYCCKSSRALIETMRR